MPPPSTGPTSPPTNWPVLSQPRAKPSRCSGTRVATSAMEAAENPAKAPISARTAKNSHTVNDRPISAVKMPIAKVERSSICLRPRRSAMRPQSGEAKAATSGVTPLRMPAQRSTALGLVTPSSGRNSGMIGLRMVNDSDMMNWMPTITHIRRAHPSAPAAVSPMPQDCPRRPAATLHRAAR